MGGVFFYVYGYYDSQYVRCHIVICGNINAGIPRSCADFIVMAHVPSFDLNVQ